jgi:redox-sensing transcriptional repressor
MSHRPADRSPSDAEPRLSRAGVGRLSLYLRQLDRLRRAGLRTVSSGQLAEALGLTDGQVRRDLGHLGGIGSPGVGYRIPELTVAIRGRLGVDRDWPAVLVGVGNLARALLRYPGLGERGLRVVALFDSDPAKAGTTVEGLAIRPPGELPTLAAELRPVVGVVTVPAEAAQEAADALAAVGVRGILNFAPAVLRLPARVAVVTADPTVQFEQLAFLLSNESHE